MIRIRLLELAILRALLRRHLDLLGIDQILRQRLLDLGRMARRVLPPPLLLLRRALHLQREQLARRPHGILPPPFPPRLPRADGLPLERGGAAVEDEDGLDADEEQLADAAEEADDVAAAQRISLLVAHRFQELVDPDRGVDREAFLVQCFDLDGPRAGLQDGPEAGDSHGGLVGV